MRSASFPAHDQANAGNRGVPTSGVVFDSNGLLQRTAMGMEWNDLGDVEYRGSKSPVETCNGL